MAEKGSKDMTKREPETMPSRFPTSLDEMERWFEDVFRRPFFAPTWMPRIKFPELGEMAPSVDIYEEGGDIVLKAELPGMKKDEIDVNIAGDTVTISGEKKAEEKVERKDFYRLERSFGSFTRKLRLPAEIQPDKAKASFHDGVLEVRIPKTEAAKEKTKKVPIE
jgi:HSP20 family protein